MPHAIFNLLTLADTSDADIIEHISLYIKQKIRAASLTDATLTEAQVIKVILEQVNEQGYTPLIVAVAKNSLPLVNFFLERLESSKKALAAILDPVVTSPTSSSSNPFKMAVTQRNQGIQYLLMNAGCAVSAIDLVEAWSQAIAANQIDFLEAWYKTKMTPVQREELLKNAAAAGQLPVVRKLCEYATEFTSAIAKKAALQEAVANGHNEVVSLFFKELAAAITDLELSTLLTNSYEKGYCKVLGFLMQQCIQREIAIDWEAFRKKWGELSRSQQIELASYVINDIPRQQLTALLDQSYKQNNYPVIFAIAEECSKRSISIDKAMLGEKLLKATRRGYYAPVALYRYAEIDINSARGAIIFEMAAAQQKHEVIAALIAAGMKVETPQAEKIFLQAAAQGHSSIVQVLIDSKINFECNGSIIFVSKDATEPAIMREGTALTLAACSDLATVKILLEAHANIEAVGRDGGATPLICAAHHKKADIVNLLIESGAAPNYQQRLVRVVTALLRGVDQQERDQAASLSIVTKLLKVGADASIAATEDDLTPLALAKSQKLPEVVRLLENPPPIDFDLAQRNILNGILRRHKQPILSAATVTSDKQRFFSAESTVLERFVTLLMSRLMFKLGTNISQDERLAAALAQEHAKPFVAVIYDICFTTKPKASPLQTKVLNVVTKFLGAHRPKESLLLMLSINPFQPEEALSKRLAQWSAHLFSVSAKNSVEIELSSIPLY